MTRPSHEQGPDGLVKQGSAPVHEDVHGPQVWTDTGPLPSPDMYSGVDRAALTLLPGVRVIGGFPIPPAGVETALTAGHLTKVTEADIADIPKEFQEAYRALVPVEPSNPTQ